MKEAEAQDREGGAELSKCSPGNRQVGILRAQVSVPVDATVSGHGRGGAGARENGKMVPTGLSTPPSILTLFAL